MRKAGLSLLTGSQGSGQAGDLHRGHGRSSGTFAGLRRRVGNYFQPLGLEASFYGHAASDFCTSDRCSICTVPTDLKKFRQLTNEVSALVRQFKGSLAGEHGVGIARTEFLAEHLGPDLLKVLQEIKTSFDPHNLFNPGKVIDDGRLQDRFRLRLGANCELKLPFEPVLAFAAKDESFIGNLEQCNGCGGCRKDAPTMCPTFVATGEEIMSTRGRANAIRAALELRAFDGDDACVPRNWMQR